MKLSAMTRVACCPLHHKTWRIHLDTTRPSDWSSRSSL